MVSQIHYSTIGLTRLLVGLPQHQQPMVGAYEWSFPQVQFMSVSKVINLPLTNPKPLFASIDIYQIQREPVFAISLTQPFNLVGGGFPQPMLAQGAAALSTQPHSSTIPLRAMMPAGGIPVGPDPGAEKLPLLVAVEENASTGYVWRAVPDHVQGLEIGTWTFAPNPMPGAPGYKVFHIRATEPGSYTLDISQFPPGSDVAKWTYAVSVQAT